MVGKYRKTNTVICLDTLPNLLGPTENTQQGRKDTRIDRTHKDITRQDKQTQMTSQLNNDRRTNQTKTDKQDIYNIKYIEKMDVGLEEPL